LTFRYTDADGDSLEVRTIRRFGQSAISVRVHRPDIPGADAAVHIPLDRVEELIAGIRDTARQAAQEEQQ
jgi:hypothetical protein